MSTCSNSLVSLYVRYVIIIQTRLASYIASQNTTTIFRYILTYSISINIRYNIIPIRFSVVTIQTLFQWPQISKEPVLIKKWKINLEKLWVTCLS